MTGAVLSRSKMYSIFMVSYVYHRSRGVWVMVEPDRSERRGVFGHPVRIIIADSNKYDWDGFEKLHVTKM